MYLLYSFDIDLYNSIVVNSIFNIIYLISSGLTDEIIIHLLLLLLQVGLPKSYVLLRENKDLKH